MKKLCLLVMAMTFCVISMSACSLASIPFAVIKGAEISSKLSPTKSSKQKPVQGGKIYRNDRGEIIEMD